MSISRANFKYALAGACLAAAACAAGGASFCGAAAQTASLTQRDASLFLPTTYEQYLELEAPKDVAVSDTHIAVADGNKIYLYTKGGDEYRVYTRGSEEAGRIGKIQLVGELLYFTDAGMTLHTLDPDAADFDVKDIGYSLTSFVVANGKLYGTTAAGTTASLYSLNLDGSTDFDYAQPLVTALPAELPMTFAGDTLYYADGNMVYPIDTKTDAKGTGLVLAQTEEPIRPDFICAVGEKMYFTDRITGRLQVSDLNGTTSAVDGLAGTYTALASCGDKLYCVKNDAVREYSTAESAFTGYEITAASSSVNRLSGAVDAARAGDLLVTADAGNRRVSVYNAASGTFTSLKPDDAEFVPQFVATDGELIAFSSGKRVYLTEYGTDTFYYADEADDIKGIACVFGVTYYVTQHRRGSLKIADGNTERAFTTAGSRRPEALAADLYGNLYIAESDGAVYAFEERDFLVETETGTKLEYSLPDGFKSLRTDFAGNLYCLSGNALFRNGDAFSSVLGSDFVYTMSATSPLAFALGFEDDEVYFLFGDFLVRSNAGALGFPTLSTISSEKTYDELRRTHAPEEIRTIDVAEREIAISVDLAQLGSESEYFAYAGRTRIAQAGKGVLLAETATHRVVALYESHAQSVYLLRKDERIPSAPDYRETRTSAYLTNNIYLYSYPAVLLDHYPCDKESCEHEPVASVPTHTDAPLPRGMKVTVLGILSAPEREYAYVGIADREDALGYLPAVYLTEIDPIPENSADYLIGKLKSDLEFTSGDGRKITLPARTSVRLYGDDKAGYTARYTAQDGTEFSANVKKADIDWGENDTLRIALIVILSVIAVLIIGVYVYLLPRKPKSEKKK